MVLLAVILAIAVTLSVAALVGARSGSPNALAGLTEIVAFTALHVAISFVFFLLVEAAIRRGFARSEFGAARYVFLTGACIAPIIGSLAAELCRRLRARRDLQRQIARCCRECGYDLRGNESGRCPECGAPSPYGAAPRNE